jgi:hypothetical protein
METLSKALKKAVKMVPKGKDVPPINQCVRLLPKTPGYPARVMVSDGDVTCLYDVDGDLPNAVIPAVAMTEAAKLEVISIASDQKGAHEIQTSAGATQVSGLSVSDYPFGIPELPELKWVPGWELVQSVVHAAEKDHDSVFKNIHFHPDYVEAGDDKRFARAFRMGYETRIAKLAGGEYPNLATVFPTTFEGGFWVINSAAFLEVVKSALKVTKARTVKLTFGPRSVSVAGLTAGDIPVFGGRVDAMAGIMTGVLNGGDVVIEGKQLVDALKPIITPKFRLWYRGNIEPIGIESSFYRARVWSHKVD